MLSSPPGTVAVVYLPLLTILTLAAQPAVEPVACESALATLRYPQRARQARLFGTVRATFRIDSLGRPAEVETVGHPLLRPSLAPAIHDTSFPPACSNQTLNYTVRFHLDHTDAPPPADRIVQDSPMDYDVYALVPQFTFSCPGPDIRRSFARRLWRHLRSI